MSNSKETRRIIPHRKYEQSLLIIWTPDPDAFSYLVEYQSKSTQSWTTYDTIDKDITQLTIEDGSLSYQVYAILEEYQQTIEEADTRKKKTILEESHQTKEEAGTWKKKTLAVGAVSAVAAVGAVAAAPFVLTGVGFASAGITAGSYAAGMMSSAAIANGGAIAAGSTVAVLQSAGAAGLGTAGAAAVGSTAAAATGFLGGVGCFLHSKFGKKDYKTSTEEEKDNADIDEVVHENYETTVHKLDEKSKVVSRT